MNKEIEEIEQFIYNYVDSQQTERVYLFGSLVDELAKPFVHNKGIAEALYNAGYRKVSDSEAELQELNIKYYNEAKDLRRQLADTEAENKRLTEELRQVLLSIDTVKEMNTMCNIDEQRKQAVKEFAEKLKMKTHNYYPSIDSYCISKKAVLVSEIDELLKEYEQ